MKNPLILLLVLLTALSATVSAQSIGVFTWDSKGKFTNVRNAPNGKTRDLIKGLTGWVHAMGYECEVKPDSYSASTIADRLSK